MPSTPSRESSHPARMLELVLVSAAFVSFSLSVLPTLKHNLKMLLKKKMERVSHWSPFKLFTAPLSRIFIELC